MPELDATNIDFVDFEKIRLTAHNSVAITSDQWPLEVIADELGPYLRNCVNTPEAYPGTLSRLLILMQWSNIIGALTSSARRCHYFDAADFRRVMEYQNTTYRNRLPIPSINAHLEWVEGEFKKNFSQSPDGAIHLGRLKSQIAVLEVYDYPL